MSLERGAGTATNLNTGILSQTTTVFNSQGSLYFTFFCKPRSGDITGLQLTVQCSPDGTNWYSSTHKSPVQAAHGNFSFTAGPMVCKENRLIVSTKSSAASAIDIEAFAE